MSTYKKGIIFGLAAYIIWGILPIYWKLLQVVSADIVLAHRIIWSFIFMLLFISLKRTWKAFFKECKNVLANRKTVLTITAASIIISFNWLIFIWAVQNNYVVQASLGYYINPLVSVLFAVFFLKEKLSKGQLISFMLAAIGVLYLTIDYGVFPWISLILAITFALYGLLKKVANIDATFSLAIETLIVTPIALIYLWIAAGPAIGLLSGEIGLNLLLIGAGIATAVPLLLFGSAVLHIPLSMVGFLQYVAPTLMLFVGVVLYNEAFTQAHLITFALIWASLILYMISSLRQTKNAHVKQF